MGCYNVTRTNTTTSNTSSRCSICDLLKKIEQMQKEAVLSEIQGRCDSCVLPVMYNTKPIAIWTMCGRFEAVIPEDGRGPGQGPTDFVSGPDYGHDREKEAKLFRVEEVCGCDTVLLRVLEYHRGKLVCTDHTVVLKIDCICAVQCFDAIHCDKICIKARG